jgi:hypothetical protein
MIAIGWLNNYFLCSGVVLLPTCLTRRIAGFSKVLKLGTGDKVGKARQRFGGCPFRVDGWMYGFPKTLFKEMDLAFYN